MPEYNCFVHPRCKGSSLEDSCAACGRPFTFPRDQMPSKIDGWAVEGWLGRGFYSAVYKVVHPVTGLPAAVKITPVQVYEPPDEKDTTRGGYAHKDFSDEWKVHSSLNDVPSIVDLIDVGTDTPVRFGETEVNCHWMRMAYAEGPSLDDVIADGQVNPREAAQIALDLLSLVDEMRQRGIHHNDLHGGNAVVEHLPEERARRGAIHSYVALRVFDLGSASEKSRSLTGDPPRFNDLEWVASHIGALVDAYEGRHAGQMDQRDMRMCAQLRRVASIYCGTDHLRPPRPADMAKAIEAVWSFSAQPSQQPLILDFLSQHYNALMLPAHFAPELLFDPDSRWASRLTGPGPQLVVGMRGCGKTMLLRSLEWAAHARRRSNETDVDFRTRLEEAPLGLFVSCASLLRTPKAGSPDAPLHRLFLAFAREAVLAVSAVDLDRTSEVQFSGLDDLSRLLSDTLPWFELPANTRDIVAMEQAIEAALHKVPPEGSPPISPHTAFERLAEVVRRLVDIWAEKPVLYLLDDVSTRFLPVVDVEELLSQFCLKSSVFGFKISTESQTLALTTPGGALAREGRDYKMFDLGREVLSNLGGGRGVRFLEGVLRRRQELTPGSDPRRPSDILGCQPLEAIAQAIHDESGGKTPVYWGIQALAGMCVGDIGDVLQMYELMLDRAEGGEVTPQIQHQVALDFSEQRLLNLTGRDGWLNAHATSFAQASNRELKESGDRLRQYTQAYIRIPPEQPDIFDKVVKLVDEGVFVFVGGTPRYKLVTDAPKLLFKVAFRKVLGLSFRIPLSMRDRFEPAGGDVGDWLLAPSPNKLQPRREGASTVEEDTDTGPPGGDPDPDEGFVASEEADDGGSADPAGDGQGTRESVSNGPTEPPVAVQSSLFDLTATSEEQAQPPSPPSVLYSATCTEVPLTASALDWGGSTVIAAVGFEDRSIGAWDALEPVLAGATTLPRVQLLRYPDPGLAEQITGRLDSMTARWSDSPADVSVVPDLVAGAPGGALVVDTTSLTKALIYELVRQSLDAYGEVWVLHTCAASYEPPDNQLEKAVSLLDARDWLEGFNELNRVIQGEMGPFVPEVVGLQRLDPSLPSLLVAFVALKQERLSTLLDAVPSERLVAVASVHSSGDRNMRSRAMAHVARYLAAGQDTEPQSVGTMNAHATFELLASLHAAYTLDGPYNFQIALTGTKMQAVGSGMFAATATPAAVYYSRPEKHDSTRFTHGTDVTRLFHIRRERISANDRPSVVEPTGPTIARSSGKDG